MANYVPSVGILGFVPGGYYWAAAGWLPPYFRDHGAAAKALITALILLPMPYLMARKERQRQGREDWVMRLLAIPTRPGRALPAVIAGLLVLAAVGFFFPIFADVHSKAPLSGLGLILQHPLVAGIPVVCLISAGLIQWDYREWRWLVLCWALGAGVGVFAAAGLYTDVNVDITGVAAWAAMLTFFGPLLAAVLCLIPQKAAR